MAGDRLPDPMEYGINTDGLSLRSRIALALRELGVGLGATFSDDAVANERLTPVYREFAAAHPTTTEQER